MPTESAFVLAALFVLMAGIGWAFRHFADRDREQTPPARVSAEYMRGLNLVLNRRTDEALELFVQMAKVDDETLETHFALGHLFRRRGEVDRAIRVHQNLLARPNLSDSQRHQALFSLGEDYLSAGLLDRAEKLFSELTDSESHAEPALRKLVHIFEQERDWKKAIESRRKLEVLGGKKLPEVSHYYCELAEQARKDGDFALAKDYLKHTARSDTGAMRGSIIRAAIAEEEENYEQAIAVYSSIMESDKRIISEVLPRVFACYSAMDRQAEFERDVESVLAKDPSLVRDLAFAAIISDFKGSRALRSAVERFIMENDALAFLINRHELERLGENERAEAIDRIARGLRQLVLASARFRCTNCGYSSQKLIWHCPSCKQWETVRPIQHFQLESLVT